MAAKLQRMAIQSAGKAGKIATRIAAKIVGQAGAKAAPAFPPEVPPETSFTITATQPTGPPRAIKRAISFAPSNIRGNRGRFLVPRGFFRKNPGIFPPVNLSPNETPL